MESYPEFFFAWLLKASWQTSILVVVVLTVQWIFRKQLSARWRYALWLVVLIRLAMPVSPESGVSIFNLARVNAPVVSTPDPAFSATELPWIASDSVEPDAGEPMFMPEVPPLPAPDEAWEQTPPSSAAETAQPQVSALTASLPQLLTGLWALVVIILLIRLAFRNIRFALRFRSASTVVDRDLLLLFDECRKMLRLRIPLRLVETAAVKCPAVYGVLRPKILLPKGMSESFNRAELRFIFLHELGHVKRHDMAIHWLMTLLQLLHWFNPVIWYGCRRMAADRELACDELALSHAGDNESQLYGATVLRLLEALPRSAPLPGVVGILEDKRQMERRIRSIAHFKRPTRWSIAAVILVAALGAIGLTDARSVQEPAKEVAMDEEHVAQTMESSHHLRGRVLSPDDQPIEGATVRLHGVTQGGRTWYSSVDYPGIEPMTVTDENGEFSLRSTEPLEKAGVVVEADGFARKNFPLMPTGDTVHNLQISHGITVTGRVTLDGLPLPGVRIGAMSTRRSMAVDVGDFSTETNEEGEFTVQNLPLQREYLIYGLMSSLDGKGAIPVRRVLLDETQTQLGSALHPIMEPQPARLLEDGLTYDVGEMAVESGSRVEGEISLTDGSPLPAGSRIILSRRDARDRLEIPLAPDGRFHFDDVPGEVVSFFPRIPGYRPSLRNFSLEPRYRGEFIGRVQGDVTGLILEYEPGPRHERAAGDADVLREMPLRGVERRTIVPPLAGGPSGMVVRPDGEPAFRATVFLIPMEDLTSVQISGEKVEVGRNYPGSRKTATDETGHFSFSPGEPPFGIIVIDESGYAEARIEQLNDGPVPLLPWARVEGHLKIGAAAGARETVRLGLAHLPYEHHPRRTPPLILSLQTTTDETGRFVFERVPPIYLQVSHSPDVRDGRSGPIPQSQTLRFLAAPGETHRLVLVGEGRPVTGKIVVEGHEGEIDWKANVHTLHKVLPRPAGLPDYSALRREYQRAMDEAASDEEKTAVQAEYDRRRQQANDQARRFYATEAGRVYHFSQRQYALNIAPDGTFRVEDVPPGTYRLNVNLGETLGEDGTTRNLRILSREIEVPPARPGRPYEPHNLGVIEFQVDAP